MGNANIDETLKRDVEEILNDTRYRVRYQNLKGFIDNACMAELNKIKQEKKK